MNVSQERRHPRRLTITLLLSLLVLTLALTYFLSSFTYIIPEESGNRFYTIVTSVTYENRNNRTEVWNFTEDDRAVGLFMNNSWQTVYLTKISYPIEKIEKDSDGNSVAFVTFPTSGIIFGEKLSYEVRYRVILKPRSIPDISENNSDTLDDIAEELKNLYCGPAGPWQVNDSQLRELAYEIAGNETKVLSIVNKFIVWIKENIYYSTQDVPRYPNETVSTWAGDCDDQANLLITLCRIVEIPAYLQLGCIYLPEYHKNSSYWDNHLLSNLTRIGWHGWAVVYVPPWRWLPVDLTFAEGDLSEEPLSAMKTSAVIANPTVQYLNITRTDYVADSRSLRDFLVSNDFYVYERDAMNEEETKDAIFSLQPKLVVLIMVFWATHPSKKLEIMKPMVSESEVQYMKQPLRKFFHRLWK